MITEVELLQAHEAYHRSEDKIQITRIQPDKRHGETRMRSSALGLCPRLTAILRLKLYSPDPETYAKLMLMEQGNRVADVWQEALIWAYPTRFTHEVELGNRMLVGRSDGEFFNEGLVIEIKNTEYFDMQWKHKIQTQANMWLAGASRGYLIYQMRDHNRIFEIERDDQAVINTIKLHNESLNALPTLHMRYGDCIKEKSREDLEPFHTKRLSKRGPAGTYVEPPVTPQCSCFSYCWGLKSQLLSAKYNSHGDIAITDGVNEVGVV